MNQYTIDVDAKGRYSNSRGKCMARMNEGVQKVFGTLDLFVSLLETEIKYPILQGGILPFWTPSFVWKDKRF